VCESCERLTPEQQLDVLEAFEDAICSDGGQIVMMPAWLSAVERFCRRRANRNDRADNTVRYVLWDVATGLTYMADDAGRRLGLIKETQSHRDRIRQGDSHGTAC
jgi:hypothetical protein